MTYIYKKVTTNQINVCFKGKMKEKIKKLTF